MKQTSSSTFNFYSQIELLRDICQTNITLAEQCNALFKNMSPQLLSHAAKELKLQCQEKYFKKNKRLLMQLIKLLNTIGREKVNFIDYLFMKLGMELNSYYGRKYLDIRKSKHYTLYCKFCRRYVSDDNYHLIHHELYCPKSTDTTRKRKNKLRLMKTADDIVSQPTFRKKHRFFGHHIDRVGKDNGYLQASQNFDHFDDYMVVIRGEDDNLVQDQPVLKQDSKQTAMIKNEQNWHSHSQGYLSRQERRVLKEEQISSSRMEQEIHGDCKQEKNQEISPPQKRQKIIIIKQEND